MKMGNKIVPFLILAAVIALLLLVFSVTTIMGISSMNLAIKQEEEAYQANTKTLNELRQLAEYEDEFRHSITVMERLIPEQVKDSDVLNQINSLCKTIGVDLIEVGFGDRAVISSVNVLPLKLKMRCSFFPCMELIEAMTSGEQLMRIDEMNITRNSETSGYLSVDMWVRMFYK